jgi:CBS-domain-containing membrane protein
VLNASGGLAGIVSEADLLALETRPDPRSQAAPLPPSAGSTAQTVGEVMTRHVLVVEADREVAQAARIMLEAGVKRVPVVKGRQVVGIVSRRDLMRVIARRDEDLEAEIMNRLIQLDLVTSPSAVGVANGVVTIQMDQGAVRRLAESVALGVPGVLEVRFATTMLTSKVDSEEIRRP